jgi:ABC-type molybdate transport system substrate-binding protein
VDNLIALIQQIQAQQRGDIFIIFNQQDFFATGSTPLFLRSD